MTEDELEGLLATVLRADEAGHFVEGAAFEPGHVSSYYDNLDESVRALVGFPDTAEGKLMASGLRARAGNVRGRTLGI